MRMYGTLGNPNFVAAWCCATLPFCWREISCAAPGWPRVLRWAAAALQILAILATGSRVFALVVPLQACAVLLFGNRRRGLVWASTLMAAAAFLLWLSPARPLSTTIQGRLHLVRVGAGEWGGPVAGYGPGSFETQFGRWQVAWLRAHSDPASVRFAGVVDHAHNDYLEFLMEYGPVGTGVFLALCGWAGVQAWRRRAGPLGSVHWAAATGAASLLAIAAVDFPFHRPAEWSLLWLYFGILKEHQNDDYKQTDSVYGGAGAGGDRDDPRRAVPVSGKRAGLPAGVPRRIAEAGDHQGRGESEVPYARDPDGLGGLPDAGRVGRGRGAR
jgi:hypothetical protein